MGRSLMAALTALLMTGCTALETRESQAWLALHAIDTIQTYRIAHQPECYEERDGLTRRLIGAHPSDGEVAAWAIGSAALHVGVTEWLLRNDHPRIAKAWQYFRIAETAFDVAGNHSIGIRIGSPNQPKRGSCATPPTAPLPLPGPLPRPIG